jgi:hypothetical protein
MQQTQHAQAQYGSAPLQQQAQAPVPLTTVLFVGFDAASDPLFDAPLRLRGPGGAYLAHIAAQTGAAVQLRGRGANSASAGDADASAQNEANEPLALVVSAPHARALADAARLVGSLLDVVRGEWARTHPSGAAGAYTGVPPPQQMPLQALMPMQQMQMHAPLHALPPPAAHGAAGASADAFLAEMGGGGGGLGVGVARPLPPGPPPPYASHAHAQPHAQPHPQAQQQQQQAHQPGYAPGGAGGMPYGYPYGQAQPYGQPGGYGAPPGGHGTYAQPQAPPAHAFAPPPPPGAPPPPPHAGGGGWMSYAAVPPPPSVNAGVSVHFEALAPASAPGAAPACAAVASLPLPPPPPPPPPRRQFREFKEAPAAAADDAQARPHARARTTRAKRSRMHTRAFALPHLPVALWLALRCLRAAACALPPRAARRACACRHALARADLCPQSVARTACPAVPPALVCARLPACVPLFASAAAALSRACAMKQAPLLGPALPNDAERAAAAWSLPDVVDAHALMPPPPPRGAAAAALSALAAYGEET